MSDHVLGAHPGGRPPRTGHPRQVAAALAATLLIMLVLVGAKLATRPTFRAHTSAAVRTCLRRQPATSAALPSMPRLAGCLAHQHTPRDDPWEAATAAALTLLVVVETRYLTRHRRPPSTRRTPR